MSYTLKELDIVVHSPIRFSIMGYLKSVDECEFVKLREAINVSDSSLSQNLSRLAQAGYITILKRQSGRKTRTWISSTKMGEQALNKNLKILTKLAGL